MYAALPRTIPGLVVCVDRVLRAMPKSTTVVRHHDVRQRDVAVDEVQRLALGAAPAVRVIEPSRGCSDDRDGGLPRHALDGLHQRAQVDAVHVLHREILRRTVGGDLVDAREVGVAQHREHAGLVAK
jgi:hypothetical protein